MKTNLLLNKKRIKVKMSRGQKIEGDLETLIN